MILGQLFIWKYITTLYINIVKDSVSDFECNCINLIITKYFYDKNKVSVTKCRDYILMLGGYLH